MVPRSNHCSWVYIALNKNGKLPDVRLKGWSIKPFTGRAQKIYFPNDDMTLAEGMKNADVFIGLSKGNVLNEVMVKSMAKIYSFCMAT
jgi:malate dehydrogenase (oxaloacetate-decarboxylating)(NADP+)